MPTNKIITVFTEERFKPTIDRGDRSIQGQGKNAIVRTLNEIAVAFFSRSQRFFALFEVGNFRFQVSKLLGELCRSFGDLLFNVSTGSRN